MFWGFKTAAEDMASLESLQKLILLAPGRRLQSELAIRVRRRDAALRRAFDVAFHDQVRLVHFLERARFFADRDGERIQADRTAIEFVDKRFDDALVPLIEAVAVDLEHGQRAVGQFRGDFAVGLHLDVIAHPAQQIICCARRAAGARGDFGRARRDRSRRPSKPALRTMIFCISSAW